MPSANDFQCIPTDPGENGGAGVAGVPGFVETGDLALASAFNVRVLTRESPSGVSALQAWLGVRVPSRGEVLAAIDRLDEELLRRISDATRDRGVACSLLGARAVLAGSTSSLLAFAGRLGSGLGRELRAAILASARSPGMTQPTRIMGVLNVTPDSFSDGGRWRDAGSAVIRGLEMVAEGAAIIDVGGESTRPGAQEVPSEQELARVIPVIRRLRAETRALISIDTRKATVAEAALDAGADWVNDVSCLTFQPELAGVVARYPHAVLVLMHSRSRPESERYSTDWAPGASPVYEDVVADSLRWLRERAQFAMVAGVGADRIWIDPGFGFGKSFEQNVDLLRRLREYTSVGLPVLVGTSRKSTVGHLVGDLPANDRLEGTAATVAWAVLHGAAAVRVHDVREMARLVKALDAIRLAGTLRSASNEE
jgi:dihydropteroate synthase